jgi:hypothetical protein
MPHDSHSQQAKHGLYCDWYLSAVLLVLLHKVTEIRVIVMLSGVAGCRKRCHCGIRRLVSIEEIFLN